MAYERDSWLTNMDVLATHAPTVPLEFTGANCTFAESVPEFWQFFVVKPPPMYRKLLYEAAQKHERGVVKAVVVANAASVPLGLILAYSTVFIGKGFSPPRT